MKVLFIYPDMMPHHHKYSGCFYEGIASLSSVLEEAGHKSLLLHITQPISSADFLGRIAHENPDLIGFSSTTHMISFVKKALNWLNDIGNRVPTVCGGIHPTMLPEETLQFDGLDMVCVGEGEGAILDLCRALESREPIEEIPNLWFKENGKNYSNPPRPLIEDISSLPIPNRKVFNYRELFYEKFGGASFIFSRGCPYNCTYCSNGALYRIAGVKKRRARFKNVGYALEEILGVLRDYSPTKYLVFEDDILFLNRGWSRDFAGEYSKQVNLPFVCNIRPNLVDEEIVELLKMAGCRHVKMAIESGNEYIKNEILGRNLSREQILRASQLLRKNNISVESFNMIGIPFETPEAVLETIKLNAEAGVQTEQVTIYQPYPGTELYDLCLREGFISQKEMGFDFFQPSILRLPTISPEQIFMFRSYFRIIVRLYAFYLRMPRLPSRVFTRLTDYLLCRKWVSLLMTRIYRFLIFLYRRISFFRVNVRMLRKFKY